jgi:hypothetical protein
MKSRWQRSSGVSRTDTPRRFRVVAVLLLPMLGVVGACPSTASANHFAGASGRTRADYGCELSSNMADAAPHSFYYPDLTYDMEVSTTYVRGSDLDPTYLDTVRVTSVTQYTDVVVYDNDYTDYCGLVWHSAANTGAVKGVTACVSLTAADQCQKHEVRYDDSFTNVTSVQNRTGLACHEIGHSTGLLHRPSDEDVPPRLPQSCLVQGYPKASNALDLYDVAHLQVNY